MSTTGSTPLATLEATIRAELTYLDFPANDWLTPEPAPDGKPAYDVVIQGAGMQGLAIAYALRRKRIANVLVVDRAIAGREGPWSTFARMPTLRTQKTFIGLDLGLPSLAFRAWYDAVEGAGAFAGLTLIPTDAWQRYIDWYRQVLSLAVRNEAALVGIRPDGGLIRVDLQEGGRTTPVWTRKLVRVAGITSGGGPIVPEVIRRLPAKLWAHSADDIDFAALKGGTVAVIGAGSSAFDNAATALEAGAARVVMLMRRRKRQDVMSVRPMFTMGFLGHFADLPDADRWRVMHHATRFSPPPPAPSVARCTRHEAFEWWTGSPVNEAHVAGSKAQLVTPRGTLAVDLVIAATGFDVDLARRPELAAIEPDIARWGDVYQPPEGLWDPALARFPYLGRQFELVARPGREAPYLADIHEFSAASVASMGPVSVGVTGLSFGAQRLVDGLTRDLFLRDSEAQLAPVLSLKDPNPDPHDDWTI